MHSPDCIEKIHTTLSITLPKMAVLVIYENGNRFLVSQSKKTIDPFNDKLACHFYECDLNVRTIECYELRYDKIVTIDVREISQLEFIGLGDIPPPVYINPLFAGMLEDEKLQELQYENFLKEVLKQRAACNFIETPYSAERVKELTLLKHYIKNTLGLDFNTHPLFNIFQNEEVSNDFYLYSNITEGDTLYGMRDKIYFLPAILACYNMSIADLSNEPIDTFIEKLSDIANLKTKWIEKLDALKAIHIKNLEKDRNNVDSYIVNELEEKMNFETVTQTVQHILGVAGTERVPDRESFTNLQTELIRGVIGQINSETSSSSVLTTITPNLVNFYLDFYKDELAGKNTNAEQTNYDLINEVLFKLGASVFNSALSIRDQYDSLLEQNKNIDFSKELEGIDDFRIYLRYWPEFFEISPLVLTDIRSFSSSEMQAIKIMLSEGIEIEDHKLDISNNDWSVFRLMEDKIDIMREKRLHQVKQAASVRAEELKTEMAPVFETLSEEEQQMFNSMLTDLCNESKYSTELGKEQTLEGVLSYWPLVLYPKPEYVLSI